MVGIAVSVMVCATVAQHLGLFEAMAKVAMKIAKCPMCSAMWTTLAVLFLNGCEIKESVSLSIVMAYLANWVSIPLNIINKLYITIWQKLQK